MRLFLTALILAVGAMPAAAQWLDRPWPGIPRSPDGKPNLSAPAPRGPDGKPDLTGVWNGPTPDPVVDPANAQPWVNDLLRRNDQDYHRGRPSFQCRPSGLESDEFGGWKRFLQTPTMLVILDEDLTYRVIHMDGRQLEADAAPSWQGYSVGHWEGDTLVVESNGFNDKTWLTPEGLAHTEALRATERYRRTDFGHMEIQVTFTDPGAYARPWGFTLEKALAADTEMLESVCERGTDHWSVKPDSAVTVPPEVLTRYVGVYRGAYAGRARSIEISVSGGQLIAKVVGFAHFDGGEMRPLEPHSQTMFEGLGLGYQFIVDDKGNATELVEIHISGSYRYTREK